MSHHPLQQIENSSTKEEEFGRNGSALPTFTVDPPEVHEDQNRPHGKPARF